MTLQALLGGYAVAPSWGSLAKAAALAMSAAAREASPMTDSLAKAARMSPKRGEEPT